MPLNVEVQALSTSEKLELMEQLWESLSQNPESVPSPEWHREVLDESARRAAAGEEKFQEWEAAKAEILQRVHDRPRP